MGHCVHSPPGSELSQAWQRKQEALPAAAEEPAGQFVHARLPAEAAILPAGQVVHDALPAAAELPAGQGVQAAALACDTLPAAHAAQLALPPGEEVPAAQAWQLEATGSWPAAQLVVHGVVVGAGLVVSRGVVLGCGVVLGGGVGSGAPAPSCKSHCVSSAEDVHREAPAVSAETWRFLRTPRSSSPNIAATSAASMAYGLSLITARCALASAERNTRLCQQWGG